MVDISKDAAGLIRSLVSDSKEPQQDDVVVEHEGAALYVSARAATRLDGQTLHAQLEPRAAFFVDRSPG